MSEMTFQNYLQKMHDAQNSGVPVNWQGVAANLAASAQQEIQLLHKEIGELNERIILECGEDHALEEQEINWKGKYESLVATLPNVLKPFSGLDADYDIKAKRRDDVEVGFKGVAS